jgi:branched-chain amino acid transport system substrate-binding protein
MDVFQTAQMPLIVPCATGTQVTAKYPGPGSYIFRTSAKDSIQAPFVVDDLVKRGWTKVAIFADTTGYGEAGLKDVEAAMSSNKLKAVYVARFPLGVKDLKEPLAAARLAGANVVLSYTVGQENAVIANGRRDLKWDVPQAGAWPLSSHGRRARVRRDLPADLRHVEHVGDGQGQGGRSDFCLP